MAIWQNTFFICPKKDNIERLIKNIDDIESIWNNYQFDINLFNFFEQLLKKTDSWSESILLFGSEESTCIEVYFDELVINYVRIRIDFQLDSEMIFEKIIEFCKNHNLIIFSEDMFQLNLDIKLIKEFIFNSKQLMKYNIIN